MADLTERLLAAAEAEIDRQVEDGKPGPWIETDRADGVWKIDGEVDMRRLVEAVASEMVAALHEPSEAIQAAWRLVLDRAAREQGLGARRAPQVAPGAESAPEGLPAARGGAFAVTTLTEEPPS